MWLCFKIVKVPLEAKEIAKAGDDAKKCMWIPFDELLSSNKNYAFDHKESIQSFLNARAMDPNF